jgi:hypothetical protein
MKNQCLEQPTVRVKAAQRIQRTPFLPFAVSTALVLVALFGIHLLFAAQKPPGNEEVKPGSGEVAAHPQSRREGSEGAAEKKDAGTTSSWRKLLHTIDEKGVRRYEELNYKGFYPRLDWIARKSGPALGVRYWKPSAIGPVDAMGAAFYSWRRYQLYDLEIGKIPHRGEHIPPELFGTENIDQLGDIDRTGFSKFKLYGAARFRDRTDDSFFGSGPDSKKSDRLQYRIKDVLGEMAAGYQLTSRLGFTVKAGYIEHSLACGRGSPTLCDFPPTPRPAGTANPPNYFRLQTSFLIDFRDEVGIPHQGFMWAFGWTKWDNVNAGNAFNFNQFSTDARGYLPLGTKRHVIALRGVFINEDPAPANRVPFFLQPSLGGSNSLRGYDTFRFQGDKAMLIQAEYRWDIVRPFGIALFGDTGTVANRGSRLSLDKLKSDWGVGFRILGTRRVLLRIDEAFSNEGAHTQFRMSAAF